MKNIAFVLDNFRIMHVEQFDAVAARLDGAASVYGIELFSTSDAYQFDSRPGEAFTHIRLLDGRDRGGVGVLRMALRITRACMGKRIGTIFISHYERPYIFLASLLLRLLGKRVFVLQDSKFDDRTRYFWKEWFKRLMYLPYGGAIAASPRSADYLRFLGIDPRRIFLNCYTTSLARVRRDAAMEPAPDGAPYAERHFLCVARLVEKKNHSVLIAAFARYAAQAEKVRPLVLCGSGPLEERIRRQINELGIAEHVLMKGNLGSVEIARELGASLCLLLPSIEDQYGIAVIEAQAMGLPVILTHNCGAHDLQVRSGVNGFVVEPDNEEGLAWFMDRLGAEEPLWRHMSEQALAASERGDVDGFVESVRCLLPLVPAPRR